MGKLALFDFVRDPSQVVQGVQLLGLKGALLHGARRIGAAAEWAVLGPAQIRITPMSVTCNHTCPMCWLQHMEPDLLKSAKRFEAKNRMGLDEYERLLDGIPPGLTQVNVVGGGEPLVHPECVGIMKEIKRRGLRGYLITNGSLMREPTTRAMIEMRWDLTRVSVHAGDRETYRKVQGVDAFDRVRTNLKTFDRLRREARVQKQCELQVQHVIQRENIPTIDKLFAFAEEVGADRLELEIIFPLSETESLTADELRRAREMVMACAKQASIPCNMERVIPLLTREEHLVRSDEPFRPANRCSVGFDSAFIGAFGDVTPCCFSDEVMGNVREQSFHEIWRNQKYESFRRRLINGQFAGYCIKNRCRLTQFLHD
jgi:MoaA/NifB/PqqE/SkfB family radical SAM enzyme